MRKKVYDKLMSQQLNQDIKSLIRKPGEIIALKSGARYKVTEKGYWIRLNHPKNKRQRNAQV